VLLRVRLLPPKRVLDFWILPRLQRGEQRAAPGGWSDPRGGSGRGQGTESSVGQLPRHLNGGVDEYGQPGFPVHILLLFFLLIILVISLFLFPVVLVLFCLFPRLIFLGCADSGSNSASGGLCCTDCGGLSGLHNILGSVKLRLKLTVWIQFCL